MSRIPLAFQEYVISLPLESIKPQTEFNAESVNSGVYKQIFSSVREIGLIEPLIVYPRSLRTTCYLMVTSDWRRSRILVQLKLVASWQKTTNLTPTTDE